MMSTKFAIAVVAVFLSFFSESRGYEFCPWKVQGEYYCGSDGETYLSLCAIKKAMIHNKVLVIAYKGPCSGFISTEDSTNQNVDKRRPKEIKFSKKVETEDDLSEYTSEDYTDDTNTAGKITKDERYKFDKSDSHSDSTKTKKPKKNGQGTMKRPKQDMDYSDEYKDVKKKNEKKVKKRPKGTIKADQTDEEEYEYLSAEESYIADMGSEEEYYRPKAKPKPRPKSKPRPSPRPRPRPRPKKPTKPEYDDISQAYIQLDNDAFNENYVSFGSNSKKGKKYTKVNNKAHNTNQVSIGKRI